MEAIKDLIIDPEFQGKIPPLMEDEYKQLEENILSAGEVYTPIVTWNRIIVDGHNRWKVIQAHPEANIQYRTKEIPFTDKWEAFDWMYRNQLGRRNLTDEQRSYLIGKMYEARKRYIGEHRGNQYVKKLELPQNEEIPSRSKSTAQSIAKEIGVSHATVERSEKFAKGIDAIRTQSPSTADDILTGKKKITQSDVQKIGTAKPEERDNLAKAVVEGKPLPKSDNAVRPAKQPEPSKSNGPVVEEKPKYAYPFQDGKKINTRSKAGKELMASIGRRYEESRNGIVPEFTFDMLMEELTLECESFTSKIKNIIFERQPLIKGNANEVVNLINNELVIKFEKLKEEVSNAN